MDDERDLKDAKSTYQGVMVVLGALLGAPAVISLLQHLFDVGLNGFFAEFVDFYRALFAPILAILTAPVRALLADVVIPQWLEDVWTLSFLGAGAFLRIYVARQRGTKPVDLIWMGPICAIYFFIMGITGIGLFIFLYLPFPASTVRARDPVEEQRENRAFGRAVQRSLLAILLAVAVFYVGNAAAG